MSKIDQKSRAKEAAKFDLTRTDYFYGPRTTADAKAALERLYKRETRRGDKSSRIHDIVKDEEKILHDVIVERDRLAAECMDFAAERSELRVRIEQLREELDDALMLIIQLREIEK